MKEIIESKINEIIVILDKVSRYLIEQKNCKTYTVDNSYNNIITSADIISNEIIIQGLYDLFGNINIVSEELDFILNRKIFLNESHFFLLDPLDGTRSFINNEEFSINLSFCIEKEAKISFVTLPMDNKIYFNYNNDIFIYDIMIKKINKI